MKYLKYVFKIHGMKFVFDSVSKGILYFKYIFYCNLYFKYNLEVSPVLFAKGQICILSNTFETARLVCVNLQREYELTSSTRCGKFQKFGKISVGSLSSSTATHEENFCTGSEFMFIANCASDLTFLAPLTSEM